MQPGPFITRHERRSHRLCQIRDGHIALNELARHQSIQSGCSTFKNSGVLSSIQTTGIRPLIRRRCHPSINRLLHCHISGYFPRLRTGYRHFDALKLFQACHFIGIDPGRFGCLGLEFKCNSKRFGSCRTIKSIRNALSRRGFLRELAAKSLDQITQFFCRIKTLIPSCRK